MKIVAISDTHLRHKNLTIPECDILIHAGDSEIRTLSDLVLFNDWVGEQPCDSAIVVAGNHDLYLERCGFNLPISNDELNFHYLLDDSIIINGIEFYGTPWSKQFGSWSFMANENDLENLFSIIPNTTDVLITHGPPFGILDRNAEGEYCGSKALRRTLARVQPKLLITGHIHEQGSKHTKVYGVDCYNVSVLNEKYRLTNEPTVVEYEN